METALFLRCAGSPDSARRLERWGVFRVHWNQQELLCWPLQALSRSCEFRDKPDHATATGKQNTLLRELGRSGCSKETKISPALLLCWVRGEVLEPRLSSVWLPWVMLTRCIIAFLLIKPPGPGVFTALTFKLYFSTEIHLLSCALKASTQSSSMDGTDHHCSQIRTVKTRVCFSSDMISYFNFQEEHNHDLSGR